jgi:hypothetical protein
MDKSRFYLLETTRFLFGLGILYYFEIGLIQFSILEGNYLIIGYLLLSLAMAIYFVAFNLKTKRYTSQRLK